MTDIPLKYAIAFLVVCAIAPFLLLHQDAPVPPPDPAREAAIAAYNKAVAANKRPRSEDEKCIAVWGKEMCTPQPFGYYDRKWDARRDMIEHGYNPDTGKSLY